MREGRQGSLSRKRVERMLGVSKGGLPRLYLPYQMEECRLLYQGCMRWGMAPLRRNTQPRSRLMTGNKLNASDTTLVAVSATLLGTCARACAARCHTSL